MKISFKRLCLLLILPFSLSLTACDNTQQNGFVMKAKITAINSRIEVEITEDDYNNGIMWVVFSNNTPVFDKDGNKISVNDLQVGNEIEIVYNGQVMMSYPGQITARKITLINK